MSFPNGETVTRLRATAATDRYGNTTYDWTTPSELDIPDVGVVPRVGSEDLANRTATITGTGLYLPTDAVVDVLPTDKFRVRGTVRDVDGEIAEWISPWDGNRKGYVIPLKDVEG